MTSQEELSKALRIAKRGEKARPDAGAIGSALQDFPNGASRSFLSR